MPSVMVRGARLHYERRGSGPAMLWIPGFGAGAAVTAPALERWADRWDCITYDHRGAARSPAWRLPATTADLAADAAALLAQLGITRAHVVGVSMGGMVAQELALRFPERVCCLVLGCTSPGGAHAEPPTPAARRALLRRVTGRPPDAAGLAEVLFAERTRRERPDDVAAALPLLRAHPPPPAGAAAHLAAMLLHDTDRRLPRITAPTLVLHGTEDRVVPPGNGRRLAARIPDAELCLLADAGHAYALERPEHVDALMARWLERRGVDAPGERPGAAPAQPGPLAGCEALPAALARAPVTLLRRQVRTWRSTPRTGPGTSDR